MVWVRSLLAAAALICAGVLLGAFSPEPPAPNTSSSTSSSAPPRRPRTHSLVGEVVEIQAAEGKLIVRETLRDGSPKTTTFSTTPKTVVSRATDSAALSDIHVNDHVTIKYREDAAKNKEAVSVRITPSASAKPGKAGASPARPSK